MKSRNAKVTGRWQKLTIFLFFVTLLLSEKHNQTIEAKTIGFNKSDVHIHTHLCVAVCY